MTLKTFFEKFDQFADAPNAVAKMRAPLPGCVGRRAGNPVVSLRSTTGYKLLSLRDGRRRVKPVSQSGAGGNPVWSSSWIDAGGIPVGCRWSHSLRTRSSDAGGIPACSRWSSPRMRATPPDTRPRIIRTPAGVPARPAHP
jgi:hypothetical protein